MIADAFVPLFLAAEDELLSDCQHEDITETELHALADGLHADLHRVADLVATLRAQPSATKSRTLQAAATRDNRRLRRRSAAACACN